MRWIAWRVALTARLRAEPSSWRRPRQTSFKARVDDMGGIAGAPCRPQEIRIIFSGCCNTPDRARFAMKKWMIAAVVFTVCLFGTCAFAQAGSTTPKKGQAPATAQSAAPAEGPDEPEQQEAEAPKVAPVLWITSVEAMSSTHGPTLDVIRVRGITSTDGWEGAELVPLTKGTPPDGMLDLAFVAEAPPTPGDCTDCVGKYFVAKGETAPSGVGSDSVIHEESLPKILHVVKPTEGIGKLDSDPNRLTLVIGDDGRIVIAVWD